MLLYSLEFLAFFFIVFILFWKIRKHFQWIVLLLAGYYFYASSQPAYLLLIMLTTLVSYFCALAMQKKAQYKLHFLFLALLIDLGLLWAFKYFNFFTLTIDQFTALNLPQFTILLPLGISFYTLQVVGYLIDVYKGKVKPEKHLGHFALFVCFFPQLSAGPIERSTTLLPQLKKTYTFDYQQAADGAKLFLFGLFKKLVIADNLGLVVDRGFGALPEYKGFALILIVLFYSWQIYMDFSGYTDMARGVAKMVGINLMENFNLPYLATSVQNFWRRWHISFSSWLRDYIYFPLGGSRKGLVRTCINLLVVFTISGLWHGAAWTFVLWGLLHGTAMSIERVAKALFGKIIALPHWIQVVYAYCLITIFWIFFRAATIQDAFYILRNSVVGLKHFLDPTYLLASINQVFVFNTAEAIIVFSLLAIAVTLEFIQSKITVLQLINKQSLVIRYAIYALLVFMIFQLRDVQIKEFIYVTF